MPSGHSGKLRTLCGDGEASPDSQTHPGVHHLAARRQGWHQEVLLGLKIFAIHCIASQSSGAQHALMYRCAVAFSFLSDAALWASLVAIIIKQDSMHSSE